MPNSAPKPRKDLNDLPLKLEDAPEAPEEERFHPPWHYQAIHMSLSGYSMREIARSLSKSYPTVQNFLHTQWAVDKVNALYNTLNERRATLMLDPVEKFNSKIDEKIALLDELTHSSDPKVALSAIREWINHAIGSPVKRTEVTVEHSLNNLGVEELRFIKEHGRMPTPTELLTSSEPTPLLSPPNGHDS